MKLGGFALKKGKKKALGASAGFSSAAPAAPQVPEKVFVTDFDPNAPAALTEDGQKPLVIPLLETNTWTEDLNKEPNKGTIVVEIGTSADEQAAAEIIAETQAGKTQGDDPRKRGLVIPISDTREQKRVELFHDDDKRPKSDQKKKPILQQNVVPGLDELQDVTDKYRHDVALRPEAPDVHSDVYDSVPVEAFGAALLRGMGWKGGVDPDDVGVAPQPRHKLLGLGATKRPKMPGEDKKKRKKRKEDKEQDQDRRSGLNSDEPRKEDKDSHRRRKTRSPDGDSRRRSRSRSERRKRSRSRSQERHRERDRGQDRRDRGRHRDRDRRSRSRSRSDRHSRRR
ncbi:hypothetical protein V7S43_013431 [Phytophthora oleae]|uniref:Spp2/MOS2 G-patch domain-containing protein n=1 Tax=Phytophthora oleae TaxID=2107226 RepID=A0ABD3F6S4_9STRA